MEWRAFQLRAAFAFAIALTSAAAARAQAESYPGRDVRAPAQLEWNDAWPRFRPWEYVATSVAWTQGLVVRFASPPLNRQRETFWLDEWMVSAISVSRSADHPVETASDVGYVTAFAYRLLDSTIVPGLVWGNPDVMLQMTMIDLQAFAITAVVLWNAQVIYSRERPRYRYCPDSARAAGDCNTQGETRYRSFITGHALVAAASAGLTCVHHAHLPLYGGGVADDLACGAMIAIAVGVGIGRTVTQRHYPTDTLLAWGIGALAGYVVPSALHYGFGRAPDSPAHTRRRPSPGALRLAVLPGAGASPAGATLAGAF